MLSGVIEFDETRGLLLVEHWCERNRRASDDLQDEQRDRQTYWAITALQVYISSGFFKLYIYISISERKMHISKNC
jgi:hypothetical protein